MKFLAALALVFFAHGVPCAQQAHAQYSPNKIKYVTVTIAASDTASSAADIGGYQLVGISLPTTMTGTALTLQASTSLAGTYQAVYGSSGQVSYTIAGGRYIAVPLNDALGIQFIKVVSGSTEASARSIVLHLKGI